ncbi:hypothetical protein D3C71_1384010 [compost metagenome]
MLAARKTAADRLDYDMDFTGYLGAGDAINSVEAEVDPGITLAATALYGAVVKLWIDGGSAGQSYHITLTASSNQGRVKQVGLLIRVTES